MHLKPNFSNIIVWFPNSCPKTPLFSVFPVSILQLLRFLEWSLTLLFLSHSTFNSSACPVDIFKIYSYTFKFSLPVQLPFDFPKAFLVHDGLIEFPFPLKGDLIWTIVILVTTLIHITIISLLDYSHWLSLVFLISFFCPIVCSPHSGCYELFGI